MSAVRIAKFWSKIDVRGPDECWPCKLKPMWNGYCSTRLVSGSSKRTAHSIAFELGNGQPVPRGMVVCHKCDNRTCCNPDHLFLGTYSDNTQDMLSKGRHGTQMRGYKRKLTQAQADQIRAEYASGDVTQVELSERYGIAAQNISLIVTDRSYVGKVYGPKRRRICSVDGCGLAHCARGLCHTHWAAARTAGQPDRRKGPKKPETIAKQRETLRRKFLFRRLAEAFSVIAKCIAVTTTVVEPIRVAA